MTNEYVIKLDTHYRSLSIIHKNDPYIIFLYRAGSQVLWLLQRLLFLCCFVITCHQILIQFFPKMVDLEFVICCLV